MPRKRRKKRSLDWKEHERHVRLKELAGVKRWVTVLTARQKLAPDDSWVKGMLKYYTQRQDELEILIAADKEA